MYRHEIARDIGLRRNRLRRRVRVFDQERQFTISFRGALSERLRAAVLSELAIELEDPLVGHRLEHQIGQRPYQGIDPVGRSPERKSTSLRPAGAKPHI